mgnify:CR=1 FL=1
MTTPKTPAKAPAKKRGLGRGLEALLGPKAAAEARRKAANGGKPAGKGRKPQRPVAPR